MKLLVLVVSVLWCLVAAQKGRPYHLHSLPNTRTFENEPKLDIFLQNQHELNSESRRPQFSKDIGGDTHGRHERQLHTDPARHIIHFPQHTDKDSGRNYKDVSFDRNPFREHTEALSGLRNPSQPSGLVNFGDLKIAENRANTFQIHSIVQPKVTRTIFINGVKVENDSEQNVAGIISALLLQNPHTSTAQNEAKPQGLNVNPVASYNQQNNAQVPSYILSHLNNYKPGSEYSNVNQYSNDKGNNHIPAIDIRMGHFGHSKLAMLREKGRYIKNATSVYSKRHVNQNNINL